MNQITVRQARQADLRGYARLQEERWSDRNRATLQQLESRFRAHPQGMFVAEHDGRVVGATFVMRIASYDFADPPSWYEVTNNGYCDNHQPTGPIMFGVDVSTAFHVGAVAADRLLLACAQLAVEANIEQCLYGSRLPGYSQYRDTMSAAEYLRRRDEAGQFLDPLVRYYTSIPGMRPIKLLPNYFDDPESCDYGVLMAWQNPFYLAPLRTCLRS